MIWWEKTVEYRFILAAEREKGLEFAAPLSGVQEVDGDGIFSSNSKLILVEFKRSEKELKTEENKFICYEKAKRKMKGRDSHHFLVYGSENNNDFNLHAKHYFSLKEFKPTLSILDQGLDNKEFKSYLKDLIKFKKVDGRSDGTVGPESLASVVGVSSSEAGSISFTEYVRIALPDLYKALKPTKKINTGIGSP